MEEATATATVEAGSLNYRRRTDHIARPRPLNASPKSQSHRYSTKHVNSHTTKHYLTSNVSAPQTPQNRSYKVNRAHIHLN